MISDRQTMKAKPMQKRQTRRMFVVLDGDNFYSHVRSTRTQAVYDAEKCMGFRPWKEIKRERGFRCVPVTVIYTLPSPHRRRRG